MTTTKAKIEFQVSDHGAGKKSVQLFQDGKLLEDCAIVRDVNGWRVVGNQKYDTPQHKTAGAAAEHYATLVYHAQE